MNLSLRATVVLVAILVATSAVAMSCGGRAIKLSGGVAIVNGHTFSVEVADTVSRQNQGLAGRDSLAQDAGMLFVFGTEGPHTFWMKGMKFPLDLIFIDSSRTIVDITSLDPQPDIPDSALDRYQSPRAQYVLEINRGSADELGIAVGMTVQLFLGQD